MGFFDLNIPYRETSPADKATARETDRTKLVVKAMVLGYTGIAYDRTIKGVMSDQHRCSIPLLSLSSLLKVAPSLSLSAKLHRDMLGIPAASPFRQYTRLTVCVASSLEAQALNSGNPILKTYDLVAVRPLNQTAFDQACGTMEVDIISIDFSEKLPFRLKQPMVKAATERGVYFEVTYFGLIQEDVQRRRRMISNVKLLVQWTRGRNIILSSGASSVSELRGPYDVANLSLLMGLSEERAKAALSKNCRTLVGNALRKKQFYKDAIKVEAISSDVMARSKQGWYAELLKWDPISSGEGDLSLDDMAKSFSASSQASKTAKAIDFTTVIDSMPSHGFQVKDFMSASNVSPFKPNNDENFLPHTKLNQSTAVVNNITEQPNSVDLHPEPDKSSLSDAPTVHQAASCANFTDKSISSGTIEASNLNEEIKTSTKLEIKHVNGSDINCTLLEATPHDLQSEECISSSAIDVLKPDENEKLHTSSSDAIVDDAHNNHGKVDIFNPSMDIDFPAFILEKHNNKKSSDVKLNSQIAKTREPLPKEDIEIAEPIVLETNLPISQNLMDNERLSKQEIDAIEPDEMKKEDYSPVAINLSPDVSMEDQKNEEASADFDQLALIQSVSGIPRAKRRTPNRALLFPFKRLLKTVAFKKKAKRNKRHD
ncbi:hypothetical protein L6164_028735 [Bauhinia variegata]|uniref:Uncharacterized protein n=1 Tax=Bauhinia variegata TaxID=167791 RepID=A0ACB9L734_BAUVA|nr:hypothetical protein L6164_028735 [Bauhinia variegata]